MMRFCRRWTLAAVSIAVAGCLITAGLWWLNWRVNPPPSIFDDPVDDVAQYFATDDFNALPIDERMHLIAEFVERFRELSQSESAVLSGFFAGLTGPTREQLQENVRILARDIMTDGAEGYFQTPPEERPAYMNEWLVRWPRFGERIARGGERSISDTERIERMRGERDEQNERLRTSRSERDLTGRDAVRFMDFWRREVETVASPRQQGRIMKFMRDLRTHLSDG